MGTTADKLNAILTSKEAMRLAIESGGVPCSTEVPLSGYAAKIAQMPDGLIEIINAKNSIVNIDSSYNRTFNRLTNGNNVFYRAVALATFTSDLPTLTNGENMFYTCGALTTFISDLSALINANFMFYSCGALTTFTSNLSALINCYSMFYNCGALKNITLTGILNCDGLSFNTSPLLTVESILNVISVLKDRTGESAYMLTFGATNLAKLTAGQIAVARNKNWTLS